MQWSLPATISATSRSSRWRPRRPPRGRRATRTTGSPGRSPSPCRDVQHDLDRALPVRRTGLVPVARAPAGGQLVGHEPASAGDLEHTPERRARPHTGPAAARSWFRNAAAVGRRAGRPGPRSGTPRWLRPRATAAAPPLRRPRGHPVRRGGGQAVTESRRAKITPAPGIPMPVTIWAATRDGPRPPGRCAARAVSAVRSIAARSPPSRRPRQPSGASPGRCRHMPRGPAAGPIARQVPPGRPAGPGEPRRQP